MTSSSLSSLILKRNSNITVIPELLQRILQPRSLAVTFLLSRKLLKKIDTSKFELNFAQSMSAQYLFLLVCSCFPCGMEAKCEK